MQWSPWKLEFHSSTKFWISLISCNPKFNWPWQSLLLNGTKAGFLSETKFGAQNALASFIFLVKINTGYYFWHNIKCTMWKVLHMVVVRKFPAWRSMASQHEGVWLNWFSHGSINNCSITKNYYRKYHSINWVRNFVMYPWFASPVWSSSQTSVLP